MGGLAGHMSHLYGNPNLTFSQIKDVLQKASEGELQGTEKTDGQNLYISYSVKDGRAKSARNKGNIKGGGLDARALAQKFSEHSNPNLVKAFVDAFTAFERAVNMFPEDVQLQIFGPDANIFYNAEIQDPRTANVINYDTKNLNIHRVGHAEFDRETGKVTDKDVSRSAKMLEDALDSVQDRMQAEEFGVQMNAFKNLKGLADDKALKIALDRLEKEISAEGISDSQSIGEYLVSRVDNVIKNKVNLSQETRKELVRRILKQKGATVRTVLATLPKGDERIPMVRQFINDGGVIIKTAIYPIEDIIHDFSVEMLRGLESAFVLNNESEVDRLRADVADAIEKIKASGNEDAMKILQQHLMKLKDVKNISTAAEGFVFDYDGHTYKFTGNFAPVNQILGLFKYGRGKVPPIQNLKEQISKKADIALYPGAFKPPHRGHLAAIKALKKQAKKVVVLISNPMGATRALPLSKTVITAEKAKEMFEKMLGGVSGVEIIVSPQPSPVSAAIQYVEDAPSDGLSTAPKGSTVVLGCGDKGSDLDRYKNVDELPSVKKGLDPSDFHASDMRLIADLSAEDDVADLLFKDFVPDGVNYKNILSTLGVQKKSLTMEYLFSLVEEVLDEKMRTTKAVQDDYKKQWQNTIDMINKGANTNAGGGKGHTKGDPDLKSAPPGGGAMEEEVESDEEVVDEISSMAGGSVQGAPSAGGGPFQHSDIEKENEDEKKRSKLKMKTALVGEKKKKDPAKGTGKKPKGSGRRLYTDEDPSDTVSVKFSTVQDIKDTLSKASFKSKSHKRQSQIINLIHQRARAAYQNAKDPEVKARLKKAYDYAEKRKEASKKKTQAMKNKNESVDQYIDEILNYLSVKDAFLGE
jgi:cytidyltransferase-like protein